MTNIVHANDHSGITIRAERMGLNRILIRMDRKSQDQEMIISLSKDRSLHFITDLLRVWCDIDG